jgi:hypothetical protein
VGLLAATLRGAQFARPSFRQQVVVELRAHGIVSMPIFYSLI